MTGSDRPLPTPPRSRFGRPVRGEDDAGPLTADRLTQAAAEGRLEDFLQSELPEGEHARNLAMMMLGMSGLMPGGAPQGAPSVTPGPGAATPGGAQAPATSGETGAAVPPEVLAATMQGDVSGLMSLLRAEHGRRSGEGLPSSGLAAPSTPAPVPEAPLTFTAPETAGGGRAGIDQALVDELIRVAADNQVSVDWLLLRAVKLYLEEHRRTGRL